jgi:hypothetical protein
MPRDVGRTALNGLPLSPSLTRHGTLGPYGFRCGLRAGNEACPSVEREGNHRSQGTQYSYHNVLLVPHLPKGICVPIGRRDCELPALRRVNLHLRCISPQGRSAGTATTRCLLCLVTLRANNSMVARADVRSSSRGLPPRYRLDRLCEFCW